MFVCLGSGVFELKNSIRAYNQPVCLNVQKRKFMSSSEVPEEFRERSKATEGEGKRSQKSSRPDASEESKSQSYTTSYTSSKSPSGSSSSYTSSSSSYTSSGSSYTSSGSSYTSSESESDFEYKDKVKHNPT